MHMLKTRPFLVLGCRRAMDRGSRNLLLLFSPMTFALLVLSLTLMPSFSYAEIPPVNSTFLVINNDMSPYLHQNDTVVVDSHFPFDSLKVGDIIVFRTFGTTDSGQHEIIVHRVAQIVTDSHGDRIIRTKGDANSDSIPSLDYPIFQQNYIGKVVYVIPQLGIITDALRPPTNYILIGVILIVLIVYLRKKNELPSYKKE